MKMKCNSSNSSLVYIEKIQYRWVEINNSFHNSLI